MILILITIGKQINELLGHCDLYVSFEAFIIFVLWMLISSLQDYHAQCICIYANVFVMGIINIRKSG